MLLYNSHRLGQIARSDREGREEGSIEVESALFFPFCRDRLVTRDDQKLMVDLPATQARRCGRDNLCINVNRY